MDPTRSKIQILTIKALLAGARVEMPPTSITFTQAPRQADQQASLLLPFEMI
jgi:hypothetical protein